MDYGKVITGFLSRAYKMDDGKIAELLKNGDDITEDDIVNALLTEDATRVANLKKATDTSGKFQEGYAKGKKESLTLLENELRDKFQVQSDKAGLDLIQEIVEFKAAEKGSGKKGEVTEEDVKRHPAYQTLESRYKKDLKAKDDEWTGKLNEIQEQYRKKETFGSIKNRALNALEGLNPILPKNPSVASNQKNWFVKALEGYEYDLQGDRVVVMKEGKVVEDSHGNSVDFNELVKETASQFFEFQQNNGGGNANNRNEQNENPNGYPAGITKPKNIEELTVILNNPKIELKDRQRVMELYEAENKTG